MNILVTGGAGFIGTNLIKRLLALKHNVTSIDNYYTGLESNHQRGATYIAADIRDISDYSVYGKIDLVFHLAAIARILPSFERPLDYFETNALGTFKICKYCATNKIPMVYAGSSSHHSGKFKNPYTFSKDVGEEVVSLYQTHYKLMASVARFYNVYGPFQLKEGGYRTLIGIWEDCIERGDPLTIYGDGSKRRDFTHVDDIVDGLILIFSKEKWGNVFELGRGKNHSIIEVAKMFDHPFIYDNDREGEAQDTLSDNELTKKILGWEPKRNLEDYIINYKKASNGK